MSIAIAETTLVARAIGPRQDSATVSISIAKITLVARAVGPRLDPATVWLPISCLAVIAGPAVAGLCRRRERAHCREQRRQQNEKSDLVLDGVHHDSFVAYE